MAYTNDMGVAVFVLDEKEAKAVLRSLQWMSNSGYPGSEQWELEAIESAKKEIEQGLANEF